MNEKQKCCIILFDEVSLQPTLNFNKFHDVVNGGSCDMMDAVECNSVTSQIVDNVTNKVTTEEISQHHKCRKER